MTKFEDKLLSDLLVEHGAELATANRPQPRRPASRPAWIAAGALAVAAPATAGITVFGDTPPAYAVIKNNDGTVTVTIKDLKAIESANAKLRELGVRAKVVPQTTDCPSVDPSRFTQGSYQGLRLADKTDTVTIGAGIPAGHTVLLSLEDDPAGWRLIGSLPVKDPAPSCVLHSSIDPATRPGN